jgi:hypothetical protein
MDARLEKTLSTVSHVFEVSKDEIMGTNRARKIIEARHMAAKLLVEVYEISEYHTGKLLYGDDGKQHHKTVSHAINNAANMINQHLSMREKYCRCYSILSGDWTEHQLSVLYTERIELDRKLKMVNFQIAKYEKAVIQKPVLNGQKRDETLITN